MRQQKVFCPICEKSFTTIESLQEHRKSAHHRERILQKFYTKRRDAWTRRKDDIEITVMPDSALISDEKVQIIIEDEHPPSVELVVTNTSRTEVMLENVQPLYYCSNLILTDEHGLCNGQSCLQLKPDAAYSVTFSASPDGEGCFEVPVFFQFRKKYRKEEPQYQLLLLCMDYLNRDGLEVAESSYDASEESRIEMRRKALVPPSPKLYLPGKPQPGYSASEKFKYLYPYPAYLRELVVVNFNPKYLVNDSLKEELRKLIEFGKKGLSLESYSRWFDLQLWIEEIEREINLTFTHMNDVEMVLHQNVHGEPMVLLDVPGVEEKHPNVVPGDSIFVRLPSEEPPVIYEGIVHDVVGCTLHLGFGDEFLFLFRSGMKVNVQFWFQRTIFIRCHASLRHCGLVKQFLFPKKHTTPFNEDDLVPLDFFDKRVANNPRQRRGVEAIVNEVSAPAPYIIFGPPGTGKTSTIVEAIKQVHKRCKKNSILVCGPSNASCDILTKGLLEHIPPGEILRVNAKSRVVSTIPGHIQKVSYLDGNCALIPSLDRVRTYSIVVMTYVTAYNVVPIIQEKTEESSFSHLFLDECGYTLETEAFIPLLTLPRMVVIAGDPRQLGPVVSNINHAKTNIFHGFRLDQSYLERLMAMPMYKPQQGKYNERYITKLLMNYRSHPKILEVSNKLFYDSQLMACGDRKILNCMLHWKELPNKKFPVLFRGVNGRDERMPRNPSFFNIFEVFQVVEYVRELVTDMGVKHEDIGIVTPYREQMKRIRDALEKKVGHKGAKIRIGTPEVFQGDERRVVIVSTVRANPERLADQASQLGFLSNPKRFNVAITRARALLVVVGYPRLLERDKYWGYFLKYCWDNKCYRGCDYDPSEEEVKKEVDEIDKNFKDLKICVEMDTAE